MCILHTVIIIIVLTTRDRGRTIILLWSAYTRVTRKVMVFFFYRPFRRRCLNERE